MTGTDTQADEYAAAVRAALADLPAGEREELLADLAEHLAEVAGEDDGIPLADRLGPPHAYAAELRTAAGLPPAGPPATGPAPSGSAAEGDRPAAGAAVPATARASGLWRVWWVLRGALLGGVVVGVLGLGLTPLLVLGSLAVAGSVLLGVRAAADPGLRWASIAATVVTVLALLIALGAATSARTESGGGAGPIPGAVR